MGSMVSFTSPRVAEVVEEDRRRSARDEVRLRTLFSGISAGTELTAYRGSNPYLTKKWDEERRLFVDGSTSFEYPVDGWGYEEVGEVVEVGGRRHGHHARRPGLGHLGPPHLHRSRRPSARSRRILAADADPRIGIFSQIGAIGLNVMLDADIHVGETVAVFGLGRARADRGPARPAERRPGDRGRRHRRPPRAGDRARRRRACSTPAEGEVAERIRELTDGRGADVCLEVTGNYRALHEAIRVGGVQLAGLRRRLHAGRRRRAAARRGVPPQPGRRSICSQISGVAPALQHRWDGYRLARTAMDLATSGRLRLTDLISHTMPMSEAAEAFTMLDEHPEQALQVVLSFDEPTA